MVYISGRPELVLIDILCDIIRLHNRYSSCATNDNNELIFFNFRLHQVCAVPNPAAPSFPGYLS